jgi:hypothetical protein
LLRAVAVTENLGLEVYIYKPGVALIAISNEATVSGKACRLAPVAIDMLNLSELYVARPAFPPFRVLLPGLNLTRFAS